MSEAVPPGSEVAEENSTPFSLANHFLIAMPNMVDPSFSGTVIYLCEHTPRGALGLVINRPTDMTVATLFDKVGLSLKEHERAREPVLYGGPVQPDRGFVLHDQTQAQYNSMLVVDGGLVLTMSRDILEAVVEGRGPARLLVTMGYAGWGEGQLEHELAANAWLTVPAESSVVYDVPHEARFAAAMNLLGINPAMLSGEAGHA